MGGKTCNFSTTKNHAKWEVALMIILHEQNTVSTAQAYFKIVSDFMPYNEIYVIPWFMQL